MKPGWGVASRWNVPGRLEGRGSSSGSSGTMVSGHLQQALESGGRLETPRVSGIKHHDKVAPAVFSLTSHNLSFSKMATIRKRCGESSSCNHAKCHSRSV